MTREVAIDDRELLTEQNGRFLRGHFVPRPASEGPAGALTAEPQSVMASLSIVQFPKASKMHLDKPSFMDVCQLASARLMRCEALNHGGRHRIDSSGADPPFEGTHGRSLRCRTGHFAGLGRSQSPSHTLISHHASPTHQQLFGVRHAGPNIIIQQMSRA